MELSLLLALLAALGSCCVGYRIFQDKIPNGDKTPNPCRTNYTWNAVGHVNPAGGGARNPFGEDFHKNGKIWDKCLCNYDSDGDGKTNGEELGDPNCVWKQGLVPEQTSGLSHPGVCEPIDSSTCNRHDMDWGEFCDKAAGVNSCIQDVKKEGVLSQTLSFPKTPVPANKTTYMCHVFSLPNDTDYHIVASEPHIVNTQVTRNIFAYGCQDSAVVNKNPVECGMPESSCRDLILTWSVGETGNCLDTAFGFRIGRSGYSKILLKVLWTNPDQRGDFTDSSGMILYYTPNLRANDGGVLRTGQAYLYIPPGQSDYMTSGICPSGCTSILPQPIYITGSTILMHYLGSKGYLEHYRNDTKMTDLLSQDAYSFDSRVNNYYETRVEFRPGDSIKTACHYKSTSRAEVTLWGEGIGAEVCYGFLTYYPKAENLTECVSLVHEPSCDGATEEDSLIGDCNMTAFEEIGHPYYSQLSQHCDATGATCVSACKTALSDGSAREPCLRGEALGLLKSLIRLRLNSNHSIINYIESCDDKHDSSHDDEDDDSHDDSDGHSHDSEPLCTEENTADTSSTCQPYLAIAALVGVGMACFAILENASISLQFQ